MEHEESCAVRLAFWRLRYPAELDGPGPARYLAYLRDHAGEAAAWLAGERDVSHLAFLLRVGAAGGGGPCPRPANWPGGAGTRRPWRCCWSGSGTTAPQGLDKSFDL